MKISVVQPELRWEDKNFNLMRLEEAIKPYYNDSEIIILPEMFATGFTMNLSLGEEMESTTLAWMKEQAIKGGFAVCGSYTALGDGRAFNRLAFVTRSSEHFYDKRHLFSMGEEDKFFTAGQKRTIINYKGWRISPFICYDLRFPVWSRNRIEYDLAIYVASWPEPRISVWNTLLRARAIENQCYVAGSNRIGTDGNRVRHNGMSQIIDPKGELIISAGTNEEKVITADLSLAELTEFRQKFNVLRDMDDFSITI
ncbi:MAG: amidohydrolase [Chloroflexota bacterium]